MSESELNFDRVHEVARDAAGEMLLADLELRELSVAALMRGGPLRSVYAARRVAAKIRYTLRHTEEQSWVFGLWTEKDEQVVADLRLSFEIVGALAPGPVPQGEASFTYVPPRFLTPRGDGLRISLGRGRSLLCHAENGRARFEDDKGVPLGAGAWPPLILLQLLAAVRDWLEGGPTGPAYPHEPDAELVTGKLLRQLGWAQARLAGEIAAAQRPASVADVLASPPAMRPLLRSARRLRTIHRDLEPRYDLRSLQTSILVRWDERGEIIRNPDVEPWQRADVSARFQIEDHRPEVRLSFALPDFLTASRPYYDLFLTALTGKFRSDLIKAIREEFDTTEPQTDALLREIQRHECVFARIDKDDTDLVLLRFPSGWILLLARFEVKPYPEVEVEEVDDIEILAGRVGAKQETAPITTPAVRNFVSRLFAVLLAWEQNTDRAGIA